MRSASVSSSSEGITRVQLTARDQSLGFSNVASAIAREGGTKDGMQVLSISTYDYLRNTCLHYIDELELVLCHPML